MMKRRMVDWRSEKNVDGRGHDHSLHPSEADYLVKSGLTDLVKIIPEDTNST
jgi:hypothetical protein